MPDYSMNTGVPHEPRTVETPGFDNVNGSISTTMPTVPYQKSAPLVDDVIRTSNSQAQDVGQAAGEITRRTRNG